MKEELKKWIENAKFVVIAESGKELEVVTVEGLKEFLEKVSD